MPSRSSRTSPVSSGILASATPQERTAPSAIPAPVSYLPRILLLLLPVQVLPLAAAPEHVEEGARPHHGQSPHDRVRLYPLVQGRPAADCAEGAAHPAIQI